MRLVPLKADASDMQAVLSNEKFTSFVSGLAAMVFMVGRIFASVGEVKKYLTESEVKAFDESDASVRSALAQVEAAIKASGAPVRYRLSVDWAPVLMMVRLVGPRHTKRGRTASGADCERRGGVKAPLPHLPSGVCRRLQGGPQRCKLCPGFAQWRQLSRSLRQLLAPSHVARRRGAHSRAQCAKGFECS